MQAHDIFLFQSQHTSPALLFPLTFHLPASSEETCLHLFLSVSHSFYCTFVLCWGHIGTSDWPRLTTCKAAVKGAPAASKDFLAAPRLPISFVLRLSGVSLRTPPSPTGEKKAPPRNRNVMHSPAAQEGSARKRSTCTRFTFFLHLSPLCHSLLYFMHTHTHAHCKHISSCYIPPHLSL